jgi:formate dehydrogenase subunit delta
MSPDKFVYMANQITKFFANKDEETAVAAITDHIVKFWDPRMRATIIAHVAAGGESTLLPRARKAVLRLPKSSSSQAAATKAADNQPGHG